MPLAPGSRLGAYEILTLIGSGGMGEVYRARDHELQRDVAIKILPANCSRDSDRLHRFQQEARAAASLNHPGILTVFEFGIHEESPFIVMELLEGRTLRELIPTGGLPVRRAVDYAAQLCAAVAIAHGRHIVHRDLKPENVFVTRTGVLKVLDFGLAKLKAPIAGNASSAGTEHQTADGTILGTVGYMAPEQARGDDVDGRTDIFSIGAITYELLTGRRAFGGRTPVDALSAVLTSQPQDLRSLSRDIPEALELVVNRCLAKSPAARFQNAEDLAFAFALSTSDSRSASGAPRPATGSSLVESTFVLTDDVCRQLDRASLDPRVIGDRLHYVDNGVDSRIVVCYLHGTGLDHREFDTALRESPYRAIAPTLYGFEPHRAERVPLSVANHLIVLREWLTRFVEQQQPDLVVLVGHSAGSDLWLRFLSTFPPEPMRIAGVVALDVNINLETCWLTNVLAHTMPEDPAKLIDALRQIASRFSSVHEWVNTHDYLVRMLRKFQNDIEPLTRFSAEIVKPFEGTGHAAFATYFRNASTMVKRVRLVFSGRSESNRGAVLQLKMANLESEFLGQLYKQDSIVVERDADHFDLLQPALIRPHVDAIVGLARAGRV